MLLFNRLRLVLIGFVAVSVSLPMAWVSLGKLVLFVTCLVFLGARLTQKNENSSISQLWSAKVILLIVAAFGMSLLWTQAPSASAVQAFVKHSKLLEVIMLASLITSRREALLALSAFFVSQAIFILTSWAMAAGVTVPWASSEWATVAQYKSIVFSTYLDQTLIFSVVAALFWHLRPLWTRWRLIAVFFAVAAIVNILFLQEGRTGYVAALITLTLAVMWELPKKLRFIALVVTPLLLMTGLFLSSAQVASRVTQVVNESLQYKSQGNSQGASESSSGFRLHAWHRSLQAMAERPLSGYGVGSWTQTVKRLEGPNADQIFGRNLTSNPHQEYLMWGVELGIGGSLLLLALLVSLIRDALTFEAPVMRATLSAVAVMAVACLFNASLFDALIGDFFCITLGLLLALGTQRDRATT